MWTEAMGASGSVPKPGQQRLHRALPDADDSIPEVQPVVVLRTLAGVKEAAARAGPLRLRTQEEGYAPNRHLVPRPQQRIISEDATVQLAVVARLELQVGDVRLARSDLNHGIGSRRHRGNVALQNFQR